MQQTKTYNLKLVETDDLFSPEALNANAETLEAQLARLDAALGTKAAQTALTAEETARKADTARLDAALHGQLQMVTGQYTGNGKSGKSYPKQLAFNFKPLLVIVTQLSGAYYGGFPWVYGMANGPAHHSSQGPDYVTLTWESRAVSWYSTYGADAQLNASSTTYSYLAFGFLD